jgi:hypothetical protein
LEDRKILDDFTTCLTIQARRRYERTPATYLLVIAAVANGWRPQQLAQACSRNLPTAPLAAAQQINRALAWAGENKPLLTGTGLAVVAERLARAMEVIGGGIDEVRMALAYIDGEADRRPNDANHIRVAEHLKAVVVERDALRAELPTLHALIETYPRNFVGEQHYLAIDAAFKYVQSEIERLISERAK